MLMHLFAQIYRCKHVTQKMRNAKYNCLLALKGAGVQSRWCPVPLGLSPAAAQSRCGSVPLGSVRCAQSRCGSVRCGSVPLRLSPAAAQSRCGSVRLGSVPLRLSPYSADSHQCRESYLSLQRLRQDRRQCRRLWRVNERSCIAPIYT